MTKFKTALAVALIAGSAPVLAVSNNLGVLGNNFSEGFGNFFDTGALLFSDTFEFTLLAPTSVVGHTGWEGIDKFGLVLKDAGGDTIRTDATPDSFSFALRAGQYALNVIGVGAASQSFYGGTIATIEAAPIPEPQTYALMLAGLGMVGFLAKRRRD